TSGSTSDSRPTRGRAPRICDVKSRPSRENENDSFGYVLRVSRFTWYPERLRNGASVKPYRTFVTGSSISMAISTSALLCRWLLGRCTILLIPPRRSSAVSTECITASCTKSNTSISVDLPEPLRPTIMVKSLRINRAFSKARNRRRRSSRMRGRMVSAVLLISDTLSLGIRLRIAEHFNNMPGERLLDVSMPRHGLGHPCAGIPIPIVLAPMPDQHAAQFFKRSDQVVSCHDTTKSSTLRI